MEWHNFSYIPPTHPQKHFSSPSPVASEFIQSEFMLESQTIKWATTSTCLLRSLLIAVCRIVPQLAPEESPNLCRRATGPAQWVAAPSSVPSSSLLTSNKTVSAGLLYHRHYYCHWRVKRETRRGITFPVQRLAGERGSSFGRIVWIVTHA